MFDMRITTFMTLYSPLSDALCTDWDWKVHGVKGKERHGVFFFGSEQLKHLTALGYIMDLFDRVEMIISGVNIRYFVP